jgi:hypothetical protein
MLRHHLLTPIDDDTEDAPWMSMSDWQYGAVAGEAVRHLVGEQCGSEQILSRLQPYREAALHRAGSGVPGGEHDDKICVDDNCQLDSEGSLALAAPRRNDFNYIHGRLSVRQAIAQRCHTSQGGKAHPTIFGRLGLDLATETCSHEHSSECRRRNADTFCFGFETLVIAWIEPQGNRFRDAHAFS